MKRNEEEFVRYLRAGRLSATKQRLEVIRAVGALQGHFDVESLVARLRRKGARISRGTVYRTIPLLVGAQLLRPVAFTDRHIHYEAVGRRRHHEHLICLRCGRVIEFCRDTIEREMERVCRRRGFRPLAHKVEVTGLCAHCARRRAK